MEILRQFVGCDQDVFDPFIIPMLEIVGAWDPEGQERPSLGLDSNNEHVRVPVINGRDQGLYILGKNGMGKSNFLLNLILQDIQHFRGVLVLDPHGKLFLDVLSQTSPHRADDVVLLDMQDPDRLFCLDLFSTGSTKPSAAAERVVAVFKKAWGDSGWGPRLEDILRNLAIAFVDVGGLGLPDAVTMLTDESFRQRVVKQITNPVVADFWNNEFNKWSQASRLQAIGPVLNKLRAFLADPLLYQIFSHPGQGPNFAELMDQNKVVLVRLDAQLEEASALVGSTILHLTLEAALGRRRRTQQHETFMLYADEFHRFSTPTFGTLLQEARKYGIATTLAHQYRAQLPADQRANVMGAVNLVCFQLTAEDARDLARQFLEDFSTGLKRIVDMPAKNRFQSLVSRPYPDPQIREVVKDIDDSLIPIRITRIDKKREQASWAGAPAYITDSGGMLSLDEKRTIINNYLEYAFNDPQQPFRSLPFSPPHTYSYYDHESERDVEYTLGHVCDDADRFTTLKQDIAYLGDLAIAQLNQPLSLPIPNALDALPPYYARAKVRLESGMSETLINAPLVEISSEVLRLEKVLSGGDQTSDMAQLINPILFRAYTAGPIFLSRALPRARSADLVTTRSTPIDFAPPAFLPR